MLPVEYWEAADLVMPEIYEPLKKELEFDPFQTVGNSRNA